MRLQRAVRDLGLWGLDAPEDVGGVDLPQVAQAWDGNYQTGVVVGRTPYVSFVRMKRNPPGVKPELVLKGGFIAWAQMGDPGASIPTPRASISSPSWNRSEEQPRR